MLYIIVQHAKVYQYQWLCFHIIFFIQMAKLWQALAGHLKSASGSHAARGPHVGQHCLRSSSCDQIGHVNHGSCMECDHNNDVTITWVMMSATITMTTITIDYYLYITIDHNNDDHYHKIDDYNRILTHEPYEDHKNENHNNEDQKNKDHNNEDHKNEDHNNDQGKRTTTMMRKKLMKWTCSELEDHIKQIMKRGGREVVENYR